MYERNNSGAHGELPETGIVEHPHSVTAYTLTVGVIKRINEKNEWNEIILPRNLNEKECMKCARYARWLCVTLYLYDYRFGIAGVKYIWNARRYMEFSSVQH